MNNKKNSMLESTPILSGEWSKAYIALNSNSRDQICQMRKIHKWMHLVGADKIFKKLVLKK